MRDERDEPMVGFATEIPTDSINHHSAGSLSQSSPPFPMLSCCFKNVSREEERCDGHG